MRAFPRRAVNLSGLAQRWWSGGVIVAGSYFPIQLWGSTRSPVRRVGELPVEWRYLRDRWCKWAADE